jgi:dTDP-4-dehydrorhamnose reductase
METPHILLIGNNGQVGWELCRTLAPFSHLTKVDYPEIDLTDGASIRQWVRDTRPAVVVNAAAYTAVDKAESETDLAMKINGLAPGILAEETRKLGALLVHYSTDYVFDGAKGQPYLEDDSPNPLGAYGRSKLAGDQAVQQVDGLHLIFRLCWVYGARGQNFLLTISRLAREREKLRVVMDQVGCPTWSRLIAEATSQVVRQVLASQTPDLFKGIYHLCAGGQTSWHGFAKAIVASLPPDERKCTEVEAIPTSAYPTPARRPAHSVLCCDKLRRVFGLALPSWEDQLKLVLEK